MKWIPRLLALFIVLPAIELALLLQFHRLTGFWPTVALILGTGLLGSYLARREGMGAWKRLQQRLGSAELPGTELVDGVIILIAGALLVTPGLLTDLFGFAGLLPPTRAFIRRTVMRRLQKRGAWQVQGFPMGMDFGAPNRGDTSEGWQGAPRPTPGHARE